MADELDMANEAMAVEDEALIAAARRRAASIPKGNPGICVDCGEDSPRLVGGMCAPCRDGN